MADKNRSLMSLTLPSLDMTQTIDGSQSANRTLSMADLVAHPQESFVAAEEKDVVRAEELHRSFLDIYRTHANYTSLCPEVEKYAESSRETGMMLKELGRQLDVAGRETRDINQLATDIMNEASTWQLLRDVIRNNDAEVPLPDNGDAAMYSELLATEAIGAQNSELRHLRAVIDWLEFEALEKCDTNHYSDIITPDNTFHQIRLGRSSTDLNPDVSTKDLHVLDQQAVTKFNAEVYKLVRAGQKEQATDRCLQSGQSWKAAMMEGANLYHYPAILDMEGDLQGTEARDIWKLAALNFSSSPSLSLHERGIIGALSGNSEPLLQLAKTWEDRIWALLKSSVDVTVEEAIRANVIGSPEELPASYWKQKQPVEVLLQRASATMNTKQQNSIYRRIQELLILDDFEELARVMDSMEPANKHQARFLAHLAIVLQHSGVGSISFECVRNYADIIASEVNPDDNPREDAALVAAYCHMLDRESGTAIYSKLLVNLSCMNQTHRNYMIDLAKQHGLNVSGITHRAVIELQQSDNNSSDLNALDILLANKDLESSLDIACEIVRNLIVMNREEEARTAIERLIDCGADSLPNNDGFVAIKAHLDAMDIFNKWNRLKQSQQTYQSDQVLDSTISFVKRVQMEKMNEQRLSEGIKWKRDLEHLARQMTKKVATILTTNAKWFDEKAKSVCIPLLVISCMKILHGSDMYREMLNIVNILCSEKYNLYSCLNTQTARSIMDFAADATAGLLESGGSL